MFKAMDAVSSNCEAVLRHAMARRQRYLPIEIVTEGDLLSRFNLKFVLFSSSLICWLKGILNTQKEPKK